MASGTIKTLSLGGVLAMVIVTADVSAHGGDAGGYSYNFV